MFSTSYFEKNRIPILNEKIANLPGLFYAVPDFFLKSARSYLNNPIATIIQIFLTMKISHGNYPCLNVTYKKQSLELNEGDIHEA